MNTNFQTLEGGGPMSPARPGFPAAESMASGTPGAAIGEARVGRGLAELLALEPHWQALAATLPDCRFIHAFDWQVAYLRNLEPRPEAVHYFSFFDGGKAIAILPLRRVRRFVGRVPMWQWELPANPHMTLSDAMIAPACDVGALLRSLVDVLDRQAHLPWDALHLPNLLEDAVILSALRAATPARTLLERTGLCSMYFRCDNLADALGNTSGAFRRNLRRQGRKLAQHGALTLTLARGGAELDEAFAEFLRLEASGWKGASGRGSAIRLHSHLLGFYTELKDRFAAGDGCLIALLKLDGVAIAAQFCMFGGGALYLQKIAYDEAWSAEAPGSQLLYEVLEYCCREPAIGRLSLVTGPAWAVGRWNPEDHALWEVHLFNRSPRGLMGYGGRWLKANVLAPIGRLGRRIGRLLGRFPSRKGALK